MRQPRNNDLECPDNCGGGTADRQLKVTVDGVKSRRNIQILEPIEDDDELWECINCMTIYKYVDALSGDGKEPKIVARDKDEMLDPE